ncbi:MAG: hypothetical protein AAGK14_15800 [Verrucomicrobiota bacterium]
MPTALHVFVTNHPIDGVKVALRQPSSGIPSEKRLILVTGGGVNTALSFGYVLPAEYTGLGGLMRYPAKALAVEVEDGPHAAQVVFPSPASGHLDDYAELLDRLRDDFSDWPQVSVIIEYGRVHADLPPLAKEDTLTCCWEARDLLTEPVAAALEYVGDRVEEDGASFRGLQLYTRQAGCRVRAEERKKKITAETKLPFLPDILELEGAGEPETPAQPDPKPESQPASPPARSQANPPTLPVPQEEPKGAAQPPKLKVTPPPGAHEEPKPSSPPPEPKILPASPPAATEGPKPASPPSGAKTTPLPPPAPKAEEPKPVNPPIPQVQPLPPGPSPRPVNIPPTSQVVTGPPANQPLADPFVAEEEAPPPLPPVARPPVPPAGTSGPTNPPTLPPKK